MSGGRDLFVSLLLIGLLSVAVRHRLKPKAAEDLQTCKSNLKNIATACEMYSTDNEGRYPLETRELVPLYLPQMPVCPGADSAAAVYAFQSATSPDAFSICCQGLNHRSLIATPNYPQYLNQPAY